MKIVEKKLTIKEKIHRGHYIYFLYYYFYTKYMDARIAGGLKRARVLDRLINNEEDGAFPVQSSSYRILDALLPELKLKENDVFVDVGSGWGRLLGYLILKGKKCRRYYGIELNSKAVHFSRKVFRKNPQVKIIKKDATKVVIKDATVCFLFNPFDREVLEAWVNNIEANHTYMKVYYLHSVYEDVFDKKSEKWKRIRRTLVKPKHHIPLVLCVYEYNK